ncbi:MAG: SDR family oxidoreductase [Candidatus Eremiobacteraeota bacterium]|nr:SDR family oxidoreductase [Candidatus Eremiobacteraeota bacterium]
MSECALVTGASGGIGLALAECFARDGIAPVLVARNAERLAAESARLSATYRVDAQFVALDLGELGAAERLAGELESRALEVGWLVNNAGFATYGQFAETSLDDERQELLLNVVTLTELTKLLVRGMLERKRGRIMNVASTAAFQPGPLMAVYFASKAYVLSFSEALGEELSGTGVSVTCLCPGATESGFQERAQMGGVPLFAGRKLPTSQSVARSGYRAMRAGKRLVIPGALNAFGAFALRAAPRGAVLKMSRRLLERG